MGPNHHESSSQLLAEYYLANPAPGSFFKRHLFGPNRRLLLQLQKATAATDDTRGRAVPAYDVRCGGSFVRRLAGCFSNVNAKDIVIVAAGNDEGGEDDEDGVKKCSVLASITRVSVKEAEVNGEKLVVKFFDEATWSCEQLPSGTYQFTPLSGHDLNVQASWEPETGKEQGYIFGISTKGSSPATTPTSPTPGSPTPKSPISPGTSRKKPQDALAHMNAERIQVFGVRSAPKGSFLAKIDEKNLERMVLVSGICIRALQGMI